MSGFRDKVIKFHIYIAQLLMRSHNQACQTAWITNLLHDSTPHSNLQIVWHARLPSLWRSIYEAEYAGIIFLMQGKHDAEDIKNARKRIWNLNDIP